MLPIAIDRYPWINRELIESVLKTNICATANSVNFQLHEAVAKGENYTSHLVRISVQYSLGNDRTPMKTAFVLKTTLCKEVHDLLEKVDLFAKEVTFYRDILPKIIQFAKLIDPDYKCSPRCFQISEDPLYFIFEDLREDKYRNMDRRIGLNFEATEMLVVKLAKFHAIGCMVYEQNPDLFVHHRKNMVNPDSAELMVSFKNGVRTVQEQCVKWPGYEHYAIKLAKLYDVLIDRVWITYEYDPNTFNTLTHGDLWVNNIMYKFDDANNPIDVLMVDYQIGCYGPPAIDLSYLLFTSTTNEMYEEDWDRLIQIYHRELVKSLKALNYTKSIPTLTELHIEFLKRSMYAVMVAFAVIAPRHLVDTKMADMETFLNDPEGFKTVTEEVYKQPKLIERVQYLLDYFDRKGFLDV